MPPRHRAAARPDWRRFRLRVARFPPAPAQAPYRLRRASPPRALRDPPIPAPRQAQHPTARRPPARRPPGPALRSSPGPALRPIPAGQAQRPPRRDPAQRRSVRPRPAARRPTPPDPGAARLPQKGPAIRRSAQEPRPPLTCRHRGRAPAPPLLHATAQAAPSVPIRAHRRSPAVARQGSDRLRRPPGRGAHDPARTQPRPALNRRNSAHPRRPETLPLDRAPAQARSPGLRAQERPHAPPQPARARARSRFPATACGPLARRWLPFRSDRAGEERRAPARPSPATGGPSAPRRRESRTAHSPPVGQVRDPQHRPPWRAVLPGQDAGAAGRASGRQGAQWSRPQRPPPAGAAPGPKQARRRGRPPPLRKAERVPEAGAGPHHPEVPRRRAGPRSPSQAIPPGLRRPSPAGAATPPRLRAGRVAPGASQPGRCRRGPIRRPPPCVPVPRRRPPALPCRKPPEQRPRRSR